MQHKISRTGRGRGLQIPCFSRLVLVSLFLVFTAFSGLGFAQGAWRTRAPMPTQRFGLATAGVNGKVYAVGGAATTFFTTNEVYDPTSNIWNTRAPLPTARMALALAEIDGVLYASGGHAQSDIAVQELDAYSPVSDSWAVRAPMPSARSRHAAGVVSGIMYLVGGADSATNDVAPTWAYNPVTNTWSTKNSIPTPRRYLAAQVINGILYAVGGMHTAFGNALGTLEAYDPTTDTWTTKRSMPTPRFKLTAAAVDGILYAIGGTTQNNNPNAPDVPVGTVEAYDPNSDSWATVASMPTPREILAGAAVGGVLYAVGGNDSSSVFATNEAFTPFGLGGVCQTGTGLSCQQVCPIRVVVSAVADSSNSCSIVSASGQCSVSGVPGICCICAPQ